MNLMGWKLAQRGVLESSGMGWNHSVGPVSRPWRNIPMLDHV